VGKHSRSRRRLASLIAALERAIRRIERRIASDNGPYRGLAMNGKPPAFPALPAPLLLDERSRPKPEDVAGAYARNTRRAYAADWRDWQRWCDYERRSALPAHPHDVADYLKALALRAKVATLRRRVAAIHKMHELAGVTFDSHAPALALALQRLAREKGSAPEGKGPLTTVDLVAMLKLVQPDLAGLRDRALLLVGFAGAFRRSELSAINVEDLDWKRDAVIVQIRRSKGDQAGAGQPVPIVYGKRNSTCPVRALKRWLAATGTKRGAVFRPVIHNRVWPSRLSDAAINAIVRRRARRAGIDVSRIAAHSLRIGHVTEALANGADPLKVQKQLRHRKLDTTLGYNRSADLIKGSSSGGLGL